MSVHNSEWVRAQLDDFIAATATTHVPSPPGVISIGSCRTAVPEQDVLKEAQVVEQVLDRFAKRMLEEGKDEPEKEDES